MLELEGYVVDFAHNGRDAVWKATQQGATYDLILMDIQMPVLDGRSAAQQIRKAGSLTPIVAMTAHAMKAERQRCLDAGMNDHLAKPFEPDDLRRLLLRWVPDNTAS